LDTKDIIVVEVPNTQSSSFNNNNNNSSCYPIRTRQEINYKGLRGLATIYDLASKAYITTLEDDLKQDKSKIIIEN